VSALYDRRVDLAVGKATPKANEAFVEALRITGLRVTFKVEKDLKPEPNKSEITVYNLGPESRQALETNGVPVLLHGPATPTATTSRSASRATRVLITSEKAGVDWVTRIFGAVTESAASLDGTLHGVGEARR
jgi:hypothetical protein